MEEIKAPPYGKKTITSRIQTEEPTSAPGFYSYLHVLWKRKWFIILAVAIAVSASIYVNLTQVPVYRAALELVLEPEVPAKASVF